MKEVHKYGGTSVDLLEQVVSVIVSRKEYHPHVCVSAFSGITDKLLALVEQAEERKTLETTSIENLKNLHLKKIEDGIKDETARSAIQEKFSEFFDANISRIQDAYQSIVNNGFHIQHHDTIMGFGEQISAYVISELLSFTLKSENLFGKYVNLGEAVTTEHKSAGKVFKEELKANIARIIIEEKQDNEIPIITGFIGKVPGGILYAIDRGYTDYCGALTASIIQADRFIIFKEVDGVCSTDPRIVTENCLLLEELSYVEVLKMASAGMKAVNTEAVKPAMNAEITIEVRNTSKPDNPGTKIVAKREHHEDRTIQNIPIKKEVCVIRFGGFITKLEENLELKLMQLLEKHQIKKFFSTTDCAGTSVVIPESKKVELLIDDLKVFGEVKTISNCAIVAIVGEEMKGKVGTLAKATEAIAQTGASIHMVAQGASEIGIDFVVDESKVNEVVASVHKTFF